jgi:hypothetical protein
MVPSFSIIRSSILAACATAVWFTAAAKAADPARIVLQNGKSIPISAVTLQGDKLVVKVLGDGFTPGQILPLQSADHIYGEKPPQINQALAILLTDKEKAKDARKLLEPVIAEHKITAKIPGNFWLEAAKVMLVTCAVQADGGACSEIGKEISDASPMQGIDPFVALGKALMMSPLADLAERDAALRDQTTDNLPADICAFAEFYRGELYRKEKKDAQALNCYLRVSCLYPSGGLVLNAASEIRASDLLATLDKREEAIAIANSALRGSAGTLLADEAKKRLESLK